MYPVYNGKLTYYIIVWEFDYGVYNFAELECDSHVSASRKILCVFGITWMRKILLD